MSDLNEYMVEGRETVGHVCAEIIVFTSCSCMRMWYVATCRFECGSVMEIYVPVATMSATNGGFTFVVVGVQ